MRFSLCASDFLSPRDFLPPPRREALTILKPVCGLQPPKLMKVSRYENVEDRSTAAECFHLQKDAQNAEGWLTLFAHEFRSRGCLEARDVIELVV